MPCPLRNVRLGSGAAESEQRADGTIILRSGEALGAYPRVLTDRLDHWARVAPDRLFIARRDKTGAWIGVNYRTAAAQIRHLGQALLDRGLSPERPVVILSENDVEHALLMLAGQHVGVPVASISVAYSLISSDHAKLKHVMAKLTPGLVFAADVTRYSGAISDAVDKSMDVVAVSGMLPDRSVTTFQKLLETPVTEQVERAHAALSPDGIAKFLFTSGSTGVPKAVITTHRMLCANQQMLAQALRFLQDEPPVLVDWLPWSHTFGGNHNLGIALYNGGTFYVDDGKPVGALLEETVRNLREIAPTVYLSVPKGFEELLPRFQGDRSLAEHFFSRMKAMMYAGASLPPSAWDAYSKLMCDVMGTRVFITTSLGSTETAPCALAAVHDAAGPGEVGVPAAGVEAKLVPAGGKLELRLKGPNVTPGYWREPELTAKAFDADGFYKIGDAVKFVDAADVSRGLRFDGRVSEDFKLATGTWVNTGVLRLRVVEHFAPLARDAVIAGLDRNDIRVLLVPDVHACRAAANVPSSVSENDVLRSPALKDLLRERLKALSEKSTGSSTRIAAVCVMAEPLSLDAGEITDKGYVNQRLVLQRRADLVSALYSGEADSAIPL